MDFAVFRGIRDLVYAPVVMDKDSETWGKVEPLSGVLSIEKQANKNSEVIMYNAQAAAVLTSEGADVYTLTVSVPDLKTRAILDGKEWQEEGGLYMSTPSEDKYYAIGFKAGLAGRENIEEYYWIYKGKFTPTGESHATEDASTTHNTLSYTYTSVYTSRKLTPSGKPLKYVCLNNTDPMSFDFFSSVYLPNTPVGPCGGDPHVKD